MDLEKLINNVNNLHGNIAKDVYPNGLDMSCKVCDYKFHATTEDCGFYLAHGWPKHCGKSMSQSLPKTD